MVDAAVGARPLSALDELNIAIEGKIVDMRQHEDVYYTTILRPAADAYSQPMPFEIRSRRSLGRLGAIERVKCSISGFYKRSYDTKPDEITGEVRRVRPIVVALDAVED